MVSSKTRDFVSADPDKCTGCSMCELVCALELENLFDPSLSRIKVVRLLGIINFTAACRFCENAPCVAACPREALFQSNDSGEIVIKEKRCNGCGWCIQACEYGAIRLHPTKTSVLICDLCKGQPKCVEWCPEGALDLISAGEFNKRLKRAMIKKMLG